MVRTTDLHCPHCGKDSQVRFCRICKRWLTVDNFAKTKQHTACKVCESTRKKLWALNNPEANSRRNSKSIKKMVKKTEDRYEDLKLRLQTVYKTPMTELEWLQTCKYFGGCALCGNEHIEGRSFFVPLSDGGNYSKFNMFPICSHCDLSGKRSANPFKYFDRDNLLYSGKATKESFAKLVSYLEGLIEEELKRVNANAKKDTGI